ncbi:hypothetical protein SDC9_127038 [bioreactor metagenome]|uniref:Uncharacterized protein n=1 Tax=bioreactor metagenome TaxID=1076179 RepID=A0A645CSX5_9ZZZZ
MAADEHPRRIGERGAVRLGNRDVHVAGSAGDGFERRRVKADRARRAGDGQRADTTGYKGLQ